MNRFKGIIIHIGLVLDLLLKYYQIFLRPSTITNGIGNQYCFGENQLIPLIQLRHIKWYNKQGLTLHNLLKKDSYLSQKGIA